MLSGSCPRGRRSTPVSGKIGSVAGSWSKLGARDAPTTAISASGKEERGETPSRRHGEWIGRAHRLEELHELLAPGLLVPLPVLLDAGERLVDRRLARASGEERRGAIKP